MATKIKKGDAYALPVAVTLENSTIDIADIERIEFRLGNLRKVYPGQVRFNPADGNFYIPLTQEETFAFEANTTVFIDARVKFTGGNVMGVKKFGGVVIVDALSREVL